MFQLLSKFKKKTILLFSISGTLTLLAMLGIGTFTLLAPHQSAHADPPSNAERCLNPGMEARGPLPPDVAHQQKVGIWADSSNCTNQVNTITAFVTTEVTDCPGKGSGISTTTVRFRRGGKLQLLYQLIGVAGDCVNCQYLNHKFVRVTYPSFHMSVMLDEVTGTDSTNKLVDSYSLPGVLTLYFTNGKASNNIGAPTCPPTD
jgi:hypothetical protein